MNINDCVTSETYRKWQLSLTKTEAIKNTEIKYKH